MHQLSATDNNNLKQKRLVWAREFSVRSAASIAFRLWSGRNIMLEVMAEESFVMANKKEERQKERDRKKEREGASHGT